MKRLHWVRILLCSVLLSWTGVQGSVEEGYSRALEAAVPWLEKGFSLREDYWKGDLVLGEQLEIKHQMFKGNEYIFWFGVAVDGPVKLTVKVYDLKGDELASQTKEHDFASVIRVSPPATGVYRILLSAEKVKAENVVNAKPPIDPDEPGPQFSWALAYGYR